MTFVATPKGGAKKDFKDYLYYNLTKSYNLKLEESIVDWSLNDKYENNAVVCYSALGGTVQNDYTNLTAAGIQPRYLTAFPKILHKCCFLYFLYKFATLNKNCARTRNI